MTHAFGTALNENVHKAIADVDKVLVKSLDTIGKTLAVDEIQYRASVDGRTSNGKIVVALT